jgi:hypothetical protein
MRVIWRNSRLTFQGETAAEHEALKAVWTAFGSQIDERARMPEEYSSEALEFVDSTNVHKCADLSNEQTI